MRYLGIDFGLKRVGLALSDASETIVSPLCQLHRNKSNPQKLFDQIRQIICEYEIEQIVVGLPLNMDDSEGPQAKLSREFAEKLALTTDIPISFQDERLSSSAADELLAEGDFSRAQQKKRRDMLAACEILQEFLRQH